MSEIRADNKDQVFEHLEEDVNPDSAVIENYRYSELGDGGKLIDFLEDRGYSRPEDFELGRKVNTTYSDEPILKYDDGSGLRVVAGTERILAIFGLNHNEFDRFKKEAYQ